MDETKILPDPLPEPYGRPYTLLFDLKTLVFIEHKV